MGDCGGDGLDVVMLDGGGSETKDIRVQLMEWYTKARESDPTPIRIIRMSERDYRLLCESVLGLVCAVGTEANRINLQKWMGMEIDITHCLKDGEFGAIRGNEAFRVSPPGDRSRATILGW